MHDTATADVDLDGTRLVLELRYGAVNLHEAVRSHAERQRQTLQYWRGWAEALHLPRVATQAVLRSALVLRGLCYGPTGAIAAAATTSLPEHLGGVRNWDYRYCVAARRPQSAEALVRLGSTAESDGLPLVGARTCSTGFRHPRRCAPSTRSPAATLGAEAEIAELTGYAASRPVRVGNAAAQQVQLDVFGPITQLIWALGDAGAPLSTEHWRLVDEPRPGRRPARWREPDHGIWEIRCPPAPPRALEGHVLAHGRPGARARRALRRRPRADEWIDDARLDRRRRARARLERGAGRLHVVPTEPTDIDAAVLWVGSPGSSPPTTSASSRRSRPSQRRLRRRARSSTATNATTVCPDARAPSCSAPRGSSTRCSCSGGPARPSGSSTSTVAPREPRAASPRSTTRTAGSASATTRRPTRTSD